MKQYSFFELICVLFTFTLAIYMFVNITPRVRDFVLDQYEIEQNWRQERLEKYHGKEIAEFKKNYENNK